MAAIVHRRVSLVRLAFVAAATIAATTSCAGGDDSESTTGPSEVAQEVSSAEPAGADSDASTVESAASTEAQDDRVSPSATTTPPVETVPTSVPRESNSSSDESGDDMITVPAPDVAVPGPTVAVSLEDDVAFGTGISAMIVDVGSVDVVGRLPGERSGPGVTVTVGVTNASSEPISLDLVIVDLIGGDGASAVPIDSMSEDRLVGELGPGQSATGQYQYFIPLDQRQSATIAISYSAEAPTALFTGALPDA